MAEVEGQQAPKEQGQDNVARMPTPEEIELGEMLRKSNKKVGRKAKDTGDMKREEKKMTKAKLGVSGSLSMKRTRTLGSKSSSKKLRKIKRMKKKLGEVNIG